MIPPQLNRLIGGLWCTDVLAALSDYLDGTLPPELKAKADAHLAACDNCARFGADVAGMLRELAQVTLSVGRGSLARPDGTVRS